MHSPNLALDETKAMLKLTFTLKKSFHKTSVSLVADVPRFVECADAIFCVEFQKTAGDPAGGKSKASVKLQTQNVKLHSSEETQRFIHNNGT